MSISSIISCVSNEIDNLASLKAMDSGVYDSYGASGDVVNMTCVWGSCSARIGGQRLCHSDSDGCDGGCTLQNVHNVFL